MGKNFPLQWGMGWVGNKIPNEAAEDAFGAPTRTPASPTRRGGRPAPAPALGYFFPLLWFPSVAGAPNWNMSIMSPMAGLFAGT